MEKINKFTEQEVKDKYPNVSLHEINKNRICLSIGQLRMIFGLFNKDFNELFLKLCEKQLKNKKGISLDFYDLVNIIDKAKKETKSIDKSKESQEKKLKKDQEDNNEKEDEKKEDEKDKESPKMISSITKEDEINYLKKSINELNGRLNKVEIRLKDIEDSIKEGNF